MQLLRSRTIIKQRRRMELIGGGKCYRMMKSVIESRKNGNA